MSIVTGTGDGGESGVLGGGRVPKDDARLEAYGTVDELGAAIGTARSTPGVPSAVDQELESIGHWLFDLGCDLATPGADDAKELRLPAARAPRLREWVEAYESTLPPLRNFVLPGGTPAAAALHWARTVCRRAERRVVTMRRETGEGTVAIVFLNRLSDLLFVHARAANHEAGVPDVEWRKDDAP
ncbi:MAG: cob(I)yrinic acid a,c-diamide adenosyltransferase [Planctomycetota bacterium]